MNKNTHNKQVTGEEAKTENKKVEKQYTYTKHNITINASSRAEADKKLAKMLTGDSDEEK